MWFPRKWGSCLCLLPFYSSLLNWGIFVHIPLPQNCCGTIFEEFQFFTNREKITTTHPSNFYYWLLNINPLDRQIDMIDFHKKITIIDCKIERFLLWCNSLVNKSTHRVKNKPPKFQVNPFEKSFAETDFLCGKTQTKSINHLLL